MPRGTGPREGAAPTDRASRAAPIQLVGVEFGTFPEISRLNPRFVPDYDRVKLTFDIRLEQREGGPSAASFVEALKEILPSLARHRCCGDNSIGETFFRRQRRPGCAIHETDEAVDVAHLLEHLVIDFQHFIAEMKICSGITCAYQTPRHRYDVFIESPDPCVSRLSVELARHLMNAMLEGGPPDPLYAKVVKLARAIYQNPDTLVTPAAARRVLSGDSDAATALGILKEMDFIKEVEASINFSRVALYRYSPEGDGDGCRRGWRLDRP